MLKAIVDIYEETGLQAITPDLIEKRVGFGDETIYKALRALETQPYFGASQKDWGGDILMIGPPTAEALRVAGNWPSPEGILERLVAALEAAGDDESRDQEERSRLKQLALTLRGAAWQIALSALGGAGGNLLS